MIRFAFIPSLLLAGMAHAESLRPAPDYYVEARFALQVAQNVHDFCPDYGLDEVAFNENKRWIERRLKDDGFDPQNPDAQMSGLESRLLAKEAALQTKYGFESGEEAGYCTAAKFEIAERTLLGKLLKAVPR